MLRTSSVAEGDGSTRIVTNRFTQLENCLSYYDGQQWQLANDSFQAFENGFACNETQSRCTLASNINVANAVDLTTVDGQRFEMSPIFLAMRDGTGAAVMIGEIQDSIGQQISSGVVLYDHAFSGLDAAIRFSITKESIEQDCVIFDSSALHPEDYQLNPATTTIELWSEFIAAPDASLIPIVDAGVTTDVTVDFGSTRISAGTAFATENENINVPVRKTYGHVEGHLYLVEKVDYTEAKPILENINQNGANLRQKVPKVDRIAKGKVVQGNKELVAQLKQRARGRRTAALGNPVKKALVSYDWKSHPSFTMDYQLKSSTNLTSFVFQGDSTYLISGTVTLSGTTVFEGGAVLKYTNAAKVKVTGPVTWQASTWRPIVMTAIDDCSVGETIRTNALSGQYADTALDIDATTAAADFVLQNLRIANASNGIQILGRSGHVISHAQFINCTKALCLTNATAAMRNGLFNNTTTVFVGSNSTARCEQLTINSGTTLNGNSSGLTLNLTNSLITAVTTTSGYSGANVTVLSSATGVYQTVGAGSHYLANGSAYRDAGTTNINGSLASDLQKLTTYPPVVINAGMLANQALNFYPQARRDVDLPDIGYHYDPIDYACSGAWATNGAVLTVQPGVVMAGYCTPSVGSGYALWVDRGAKLRVLGTAAQPCEFVWYNSSQEQTGTPWQGSVTAHLVSGNSLTTAGTTEVNLRFCEFTSLGNNAVNLYEQIDYDTNAVPLIIRDTQFHGGALYFAANRLNSTNCVLDRSGVWVDLDPSDSAAKVNLRNWLVSGAYVQAWGLTTNKFSIRDSVFYLSPLDNSGGAWDHGWNAYYTNGCASCAVLSGNTGTNYVGSVTFASGPLGGYYVPTNSALVNLGSASDASTVGFYQYTTTTNQTLEGTTRLDAGWHYIATASSSSASAIDTDGDGSPDYLEDANSNGIFDGGETNWNGYNSTYGIGSGAGLVVFTPLK